jgi:hypothetical protein
MARRRCAAVIPTNLSIADTSRMAFTYHHLDEEDVRAALVELWNAENEQLLISGRRSECYGADLLEPGWMEREHAMPVALGEHEDDWLTSRSALVGDLISMSPTRCPRTS